MRIPALLAATLVLSPAAAMAGDAADRTLIGFSEDGRVFAFAETGVQDGSGFPYANVYLIDVEEDRWAAEPVKVMIRDVEGAAVGQAAAQALAEAGPLLTGHGVTTPAQLLWARPLTEASSGDPAAHGDYPGEVLARFSAGWDSNYHLQLDSFDLPDGECAQYDADVKGFALTLGELGETMEVYRDEALPESRGCALGYSISDVVGGPYDPETGRRPLVALVSVFKLGFEGPDRRFIAVPLHGRPDAQSTLEREAPQ